MKDDGELFCALCQAECRDHHWIGTVDDVVRQAACTACEADFRKTFEGVYRHQAGRRIELRKGWTVFPQLVSVPFEPSDRSDAVKLGIEFCQWIARQNEEVERWQRALVRWGYQPAVFQA
jgi:hypothetical protein